METTFREIMQEIALPTRFVSGARKLQDKFNRVKKPSLEDFKREAERIAKKIEISDIKGFLEYVEKGIFRNLK